MWRQSAQLPQCAPQATRAALRRPNPPCAPADWPIPMITGVECDRTFPHLDVVLSGKRSGELWMAHLEVVSGPRGGTEEEEEARRLLNIPDV